MPDKIVKTIELKAPIARVWRALSDYKEFGQWFCLDIKEPFTVGQPIKATLTYPGYEGLLWEVHIKKIQPEQLFSFTWHPAAIDPKVDYSVEEPTLVEFKLEQKDYGTLLTLTESGFDKLPEYRRFEAFRMNDDGWAEQLQNIENYVAKNNVATK
ncbi:MAG: SRPBCC family protein [Candidatus Melainabacteria bacterium]|nr:SRPBCC family protein [Candidatus Melainabacteria bacterium]